MLCSIRNPQSAIRSGSVLIAAALLSTAGCIPSYPLAEGEIDRSWLLTDVSPDANAPKALAVGPGGLQVPGRWVIRQHGSLVWSTVSIVRAMDKLKIGAGEIEFFVSPAHARALVDVLARARAAMADLKDMLDTSGRPDGNRWADALAGVLLKVEAVSRLAAVEAGPPGPAGADEPFGMAAEPVLGMIAAYFNERAEGSLLAELSPGERRRLRDVLTEMVLRLGFEIAGKDPPEGLREDVSRVMRSAPADRLRARLGELLADRLSGAAPARAGRSKRKTVRTILRWAPKALGLLESFLSQWDRMESITVEAVRCGGRKGVAVTITTLPGRQVRIANVTVLVPTIVFRGSTRIVVLSEATEAGETVVAFDPVGEGAVELRFEGLVWGLVKLLALPLASGPLREVRILAETRDEGEQLIHVAVMTEAAGDRGDRRRMIVVQDSRTKRILREAFSVRSVTEKSETVVSYITPLRRYTYQRIKGPRND